MKKDYLVELIVTTRHYFNVMNARSPEDAVAEAENLLEDGEQGVIASRDVETADAYPAEEGLIGLDEEFEEDEDDD